jgi:ribonuclease HI
MYVQVFDVDCYTDGSCINNGKSNSSGGWCYLIDMKDCERVVVCNNVPIHNTTSNRMELMAVIECVTCVTDNISRISQQCGNFIYNVTVTSDSEYVVNGITTYIKGWKRNKWRTRTGSEVCNKDLWMRLDKCCENANIVWRCFPRNSCEQLVVVDRGSKQWSR